MLEWRLLVAWRVDGWHIDLVFSGSVQSAASKHGQTVKRSLARPLSRGPRPHAPRTVRELGDLPDASDAGRRPSPTHQCDPCGWRVGLPPANGPSSWLFSATRYSVGDAGHGSQRSARLCAGPCPALERASERRQDRPHRLQHHAQTHRVEARRQFVVTLLCSAVGARRAAERVRRQPSRAAVVKSLLWRWRCAAEWGGRCRCPIYCVCARALLALKTNEKTHALARLPPHAPDSLVHPGISASSVR